MYKAKILFNERKKLPLVLFYAKGSAILPRRQKQGIVPGFKYFCQLRGICGSLQNNLEYYILMVH